MFKPVTSQVNFPQIEESVQRFWKEKHIFQKSLELRHNAPQFILYEGPPTVNGSPGIHHVLSRVFKDVIPRYKTMKGYRCPRKAGWDTHGLPVELEVERELGFSSKAQIEEFGLDKFNQRCRESIQHYLGEWEELTERIGFWVDLEHPYITLENDYIESDWWVIKQLWDKGLIYQGYRVTPHCPRCGTSLSSHEVALGYQDDAEDPSVYIKFHIDPEQSEAKASHYISGSSPTYLLAWTTTPWTLPGNVALAVAPEAKYALIELAFHPEKSPDFSGNPISRERLILAQDRIGSAISQDYQIIATFPGAELIGIKYQPLYDPFEAGLEVRQFEDEAIVRRDSPPSGKLTYPVIGGDFVETSEGSGIVHIAPAFGEIDFEVGKQEDLFLVQPVDLKGYIGEPKGKWNFSGRFVKEADPLILADLEARGLLYWQGKIRHTYPFCWRCEAPLLYYAKRAWYIKTTAIKERLITANELINWHPEHIKYGRFGDWLRNNVDWAFSRERYWGTPLNIWQCQLDAEHQECIGSLKELKNKPELSGWEKSLDLHRPFIDKVTFRCQQCGGRMQRVPEVIDAWFDSGAMPVAQWHYPFENQEQFEGNFPADYICEAVDQTRGWFYTLHALSVALFNRPCFRNVICLGHILDAQGEKMSKAKGNVVAPATILDNQGADALRWYMLTAAPPGNVRRFSQDQVIEVMRRFLSTLWNTYSFFVTYANIDHFDPSQAEDPGYRSELDRWIIAELESLIYQVDRALDSYDPTGAARRIEEFVDDLSNWYVRRSRRRFWKSESDADKLAAYFTLYQCLVTLTKLIAPFTPFIAEEIYGNLVGSVEPEAPESVHLTDFPTADLSKVDEELITEIELVRKITSLGRTARSQAGIKVRQPLFKVVVKTRAKSEWDGLKKLAPQILEELNVKGMEFVDDEAGLIDKPGYSVAQEGDYLVGIDTKLPSELQAEGRAREIVRRLQGLRRQAGFDIADHIITYYQAPPPLQEVFESLSDYIKQETLSRELIPQPPPEDCYCSKHRIDGSEIILGVKRV